MSEEDIINEFQNNKRKILEQYEEYATMMYNDLHSEENSEEMNNFILKVIKNIEVTIDKVYVRMEDPYPFALGLTIPKIRLFSTNEKWEESEPE